MSKNLSTTINASVIESIVDGLWQRNSHNESPSVYAILDGARDRKIEPLINNSQLEHACMYTNVKSYAYKRSAPHLVALQPEHTFTHQLLNQGWGKSWGIFISTYIPTSITKIRHHFRLIAKAQGPRGETMLFRYYDPRVLRVLLPSCDNTQLRQLFGSNLHLYMENPAGSHLLHYSTDANVEKLKIDSIKIS